MTNITVLKDENLGGIEREYREVKRKAAEGERIVFDSDRPGITEGKPYVVRGGDHDGAEFFDDDGTRRWQRHVGANCYVIEPTDIVRINGALFRMVDRKAAVGERVIVTGERTTFDIGKVFVVEDVDWTYPAAGLRNGHNAIDGHYRVLEPVESAETEPLSTKPAPDQAAEIIAKLTTRVASLERRMTMLEISNAKPIPRRSGKTSAQLARTVSELPRAKSPQETRDDIVKRAKEDVAKLLADACGDNEGAWEELPALKFRGHVTFKFAVNHEKRKVTALAFLKYSPNGLRPRFKASAKCAPGDVFNVWIGKAVALRRALGLTVPAEYFEAPNPTEVRVGDYVYNSAKTKRMLIVTSENLRFGQFLTKDYAEDLKLDVIDDSREDSAEPRKEVA